MQDVFTWLLERGFIDQCTSDDMGSILSRSCRIYLGIDPTAPSLHLGNLVGLVVLRAMQQCGHQPVLVIGGATALIGDPSGKDGERPLLTLSEVEANGRAIARQLSQFLNVHKNPPIILNNYEWFSKMNLISFLRDVGKQFRLGSMLSKESVKQRLHSWGMSFTEFSYQVLQGFDFYQLCEEYGVIVQIGGSDQFGNIISGIDFVRRVTERAVYGFTFPLLTHSDGRKFGKSEKGAVWLNRSMCSPFELYQYLFRISDEDVIRMMQLLTFLPMSTILDIENQLSSSPNLAQYVLASEVTKFVHGDSGLKEARAATEAFTPGKMDFHEGDLADVVDFLPNVLLLEEDVIGESYINLAFKAGLLSSKGEARRLIQNRGAYFNGQRILDASFVISRENFLPGGICILSVGKKKSILVRILKKG